MEMTYSLKHMSIITGARYYGEGEDKKLKIFVNIQTKINECEHDNKFVQSDDVYLELPDVLPSQLEAILPQLAVEWINQNYNK